MKKILLTIVIVVMLVSSLCCASCTQKATLQSIFREYNIWTESQLPEIWNYSMTNSEGEEIGEYSMMVENVSTDSTYYLGINGTQEDTSNSIYSFGVDKTTAYHATTKLVLDDSSYVKITESYFSKNYQILASYSYTKESEKETIIIAKNTDDDKYYYSKYENGEKVAENSIKNGKYVSSPYYDNAMLYFMARSVPHKEDYTTYAFKVFDTSINSTISVSLTNNFTTQMPVKLVVGDGEDEKSIDCSQIKMTTSDDLLGTTDSIDCFVSMDKINGFSQVICKILEGKYAYTLKY